MKLKRIENEKAKLFCDKIAKMLGEERKPEVEAVEYQGSLGLMCYFTYAFYAKRVGVFCLAPVDDLAAECPDDVASFLCREIEWAAKKFIAENPEDRIKT